MISNKRIFTILIVIFLFITLYNNCYGLPTNNLSLSINNSDFNGYIVQFIEEPIVKYKNRFSLRISDFFLNEKIQNYKEKLLSIHKKAKEEILNILGIKDNNKFFFTEFFNIINGICIKSIDTRIIDKIKNLSYVKDVIPNFKVSISIDKSVPLIGADEIWTYHTKNGKSLTGNGVKIAIIDTGVNYNHPDLKDNYVGGFDFVNNDNDPMDDHGHGTHCAGIALGNGRSSEYKNIGVAPMASLYAYKVIRNNGTGEVSHLINAFEMAIDDEIDIISLSLGNNGKYANPDSVLSEAADNAVDAGIVIVAAAGNNGEAGPISSPGCARKVICVGATDFYDNIASFSSRGPVNLSNGSYLIKPDIVAPGVQINSCDLYNGYSIFSGTSMSTPHVAGAVALILQNNPDLAPEEVMVLLKENAVDLGIDKNISGSGRINISASIKIDSEIIIKSPFQVLEGSKFNVIVKNNSNISIKAFFFMLTPSQFPKFKYGDTVEFTAPNIFSSYKSFIKSKIIILNLKKHIFKNIEIIITNK
ncbi:hypothetical protein AYK24_05375 [Thermoplasmatales archaeon SG8-52-4]|nr:MAG: hypothetical protein AYK24_05375 [Thermoplasmatales archaeon SG8-52-4]